MKKTKRYYRYVAILFVMLISLIGCSRGSQEGSIDPSGTGQEPTSYPPMIMVDGILYKDTGYIDNCVKCGTENGRIRSSVFGTQMPNKDDQSNFGRGYSYQYTGNKGYINVLIDKKWHIFQSLDIEQNTMPDQVAHFTAEVKEVAEDRLLVYVTDIPQEFAWIFQDAALDQIKPIALSAEDLEKRTDKKGSTDGLVGKKVEVWFDGSLKGDEPERSDPIELGRTYRIEVLDE
ncbi:MAG: hypothetical protein Q4D77_08565 [Peptostreptococcaceae bacterium]|nr:hypothetical protein [Peptostreptococcaceae bacterium]